MPAGYVCRSCKGPPLPAPPDLACPNCGGYYRHERVFVREGEVDGAEIMPIKEGDPISHADLMAGEDEDEEGRLVTGWSGLDHVCGGGLPKVGAILLAAREGVGKTTFLVGLLHDVAERLKEETLYITSEQSTQGLRRQFRRLDLKPSSRMVLVSTQDRDGIIGVIEKRRPRIVVLDSLHEVENVTDETGFSMSSGGERAVTRVAKEVRRLAEEEGFFVILVGHMNNDGTMAGSAHLRHAVDGTLTIERIGPDSDPRRIMFFKKCRFAETGRKALFRMGERGMRDCGPYADDEDEPAHAPTGRGPRGLN